MASIKFFELKRTRVVGYFIALVIIIFLPLIVRNPYYQRIFVMILIYSVSVLGLNFIIGFTGLLSFGHAAYYGLGAYTTAILMTRHGFSFLPALIASGGITFIFGILSGLTVMRVRGDYLCLVTIAFGEIFRLLAQGWQSFTGGQMGIVGIPVPTIFGYRIVTNMQFYYLGMAFLVFTYAVLTIMVNSKIGRAMIAVREDELAASTMGINTSYYKTLNFAVGTFFAGIAGSLLAVFLTTIAPSNFTLGQSVLMVIMVIVGGMGSLPGSIIGVALLLFATELFRSIYEFRLLIIGFIMLFVLLFHPQGILGVKAWQKVESEEGD